MERIERGEAAAMIQSVQAKRLGRLGTNLFHVSADHTGPADKVRLKWISVLLLSIRSHMWMRVRAIVRRCERRRWWPVVVTNKQGTTGGGRAAAGARHSHVTRLEASPPPAMVYSAPDTSQHPWLPLCNALWADESGGWRNGQKGVQAVGLQARSLCNATHERDYAGLTGSTRYGAASHFCSLRLNRSTFCRVRPLSRPPTTYMYEPCVSSLSSEAGRVAAESLASAFGVSVPHAPGEWGW
eukprot:6939536-Pyramimonas_sp.AAC.2